jgi:hypothetical protein
MMKTIFVLGAGFAVGNFYATSLIHSIIKNPGWFWHWSKVWFEK